MTQLHTLISSLEHEWHGFARTHIITGQCLWFTQSLVKRCRRVNIETHFTHAHLDLSVEIYLHLQRKHVRAVKVRSVLADYAKSHYWRMIQRITVMTASYIVVIITATDSITIIINTVISNHQAHQKPYFFFFYNKCDMGSQWMVMMRC